MTSTTSAQPPVTATGAEPGESHETTEKISRMRATIAERMMSSLHESAQLTATVEVDLTELQVYRAAEKEGFRDREGIGLSPLPFIIRAAIECLQEFPRINARFDSEARLIRHPGAEHIGVAVDTPRGLLVPVIADAGTLSVTEIAHRTADLAARCRLGKIGAEDLSGGTFTVTNYGSVGTLLDTPIINQPQSAILGIGALARRPAVVIGSDGNERIEPRDLMFLSLSYDHRIIDGADAGRFLSGVKQRLESGTMTI